MSIFYGALFLLIVLEGVSACYIFFTKKTYIKRNHIKRYLFTILCCSPLIGFIRNIDLIIILSYLTIYIFLCYNYKLQFSRLVKIYVTSILLTSVLDIVLLYLFRSFGITNELACSLGYSSVVLIFLWGYELFLGQKSDSMLFQLPVQIWRILIGVIGILACMLAFFVYILLEVRQDIRITGAVLILGGGFAICILVFFLIYYFNDRQKYQIQSKLAEAFSIQQKEYFLQLLDKENETKKFRHDMISHLLELQNMLENQMFTDAKSYLAQLLNDVNVINKKNYNVGNEIVNAMLNHYFSQLGQEYEIKTEGHISDNVTISQTDLCIIVSNLVKNAIEAVETSPRKYILFSIYQGNCFFKIQTQNTYGAILKINKKGIPVSTKKDKRDHGYGFQNMQQIAKKYDGQLLIRQESNICTVTIYLKI